MSFPDHTIIQTATLQGTIKPATRPRYNASDIQSAIGAAARISVKYNCPMYVYPAYGKGYAITYKTSGLSVCESFVEVNGRQVSWYHLTILVNLQANAQKGQNNDTEAHT